MSDERAWRVGESVTYRTIRQSYGYRDGLIPAEIVCLYATSVRIAFKVEGGNGYTVWARVSPKNLSARVGE